MTLEIIISILNSQAEQERAGIVTWDGERITIDPPDSRRMRNVLNDPAYHPKLRRMVTAAEQPAEWFDALQYQYSGSRVWASAPRERTAGQ